MHAEAAVWYASDCARHAHTGRQARSLHTQAGTILLKRVSESLRLINIRLIIIIEGLSLLQINIIIIIGV